MSSDSRIPKRLRLSIIFFMSLFAFAFLGPLFGISDLAIDLSHDLDGPSEEALLGYAENGVDLLAALSLGARLSLCLALVCTTLCVLIGMLLGSASAFLGGAFDRTFSYVVDISLAFPGILLAIYIGAILKPSVVNLAIALSATGWVSYARVARAQVLSLKSKDFVTAARALGANRTRIVLVHLVPHTFSPIAVQAGFGFSGIIVGEAALSFLGIGVPIGTPSWGALLDQGVTYLFVAPHIAICTVACITAAVLICNWFAESLRDYLDQRA